MSVARQYNIIGETLRTGIQGMIDAQMESKALDIRKQQVGIQGQIQEQKHLVELEQFRMKRQEFDMNMKIMQRKLDDPRLKRDEAKAAAEMESWDKPATKFSLGIDDPWEETKFNVHILPEMGKLGYKLEQDAKGQEFFTKNGKQVTHGDIKSDADVAALMVAKMDYGEYVDYQRRMHTELYEQSVKNFENAPKGSQEQYQAGEVMDRQKVKLEQITELQKDMGMKPIKYLNYKIKTLSELMTGAKNPEIHLPRLNAMIGERATLIEEYKQKMASQGKTLQGSNEPVYDSKGDVVNKIFVPKGMNLADMPEVKAHMGNNIPEREKWYLSVPRNVQAAEEGFKAALQTEVGMGKLYQSFSSGGPDKLASHLWELHNVMKSAYNIPTVKRDVFAYTFERMRDFGMDLSPQGWNKQKARRILLEQAKSGYFGNWENKTEDEQDAALEPYLFSFELIDKDYASQKKGQ